MNLFEVFMFLTSPAKSGRPLAWGKAVQIKLHHQLLVMLYEVVHEYANITRVSVSLLSPSITGFFKQ